MLPDTFRLNLKWIKYLLSKKPVSFTHGEIVQFDYNGLVNAWVERVEDTFGHIDVLLFVLSSSHAGEMIWVPASCIRKIE